MASSSPLLLVLLLSCACSFTTQKELDCSAIEQPGRSAPLLHSERPFQARGDRFVDFDWDLSKELNAAGTGNLVISPISLKVVLAMLYEGASGQTAHEIREALDLDNITSALPSKTRERFSLILKSLQSHQGENKVKIGTHVFIDKSAELKDRFQCILQVFYKSAMEKVDFKNTKAAIHAINTWASNVTEGLIQHLISEAEAHSSTIMMLVNAVYFKGLWKIPFPENQTETKLFHLNEKQTVSVPLMNTTDKFDYYNITELDAQMIRLPYLGDKFSMYVLLPNKKSGLDALVQKLGPTRPLTEYLKNMVETSVNLIMPKFEFDFTTSLRPILEKLQIKTMFTSGAELSNIAATTSGGVVVSNVLQKAGISVTEIGTVAYAATVVELMDKFGGWEEVVQFKADHPFLFFIREETVKTTVFVGKVTNPEKAQVIEDRLGSGHDEGFPVAKPPSTAGAANTYTSTGMSPEHLFERDPDAIQAKFNYFDADLLKVLAGREKGNFVVSPTSIKTLLALILEGAEGSTQAELLSVLRLPQNMTYARQALSSLQNTLQKTSSPKVTIDSVAQVFITNTLKINTTYSKTVKDYYGADVSPQDFTSPEVAVNNINSWIRTRTRSLITDLVDPDMINSNTYAVLTSAIYFDGKWKSEFPLASTKDECFYSEPNLQCQMTPMMSKNEELYYKFDQELDSHVLQIPYKDERYSMALVLPRKIDGMKQLTFDAARLTFPRTLENMNRFEVNLKMPRFSMDYGTELITTLEKLGLVEVFADNAQLPFMLIGKQSRVSAIVHKAKIEVSEKGTKAAAASGAAVVPLMYGPKVISLDVNHPFYYFIYDRQSQTVLFAGRLSSLGAVPTGGAGSRSQPTYAVPLVASGSGKQQAPSAAPANAPGSSSQQFYSAPASEAGSFVFPARPTVSGYQPGAPSSAAGPSQSAETVGAARPGNHGPNASARPKPSNHGALNYQYNPQASPSRH